MSPRNAKRSVSGGNTTLFTLKNGKYVRRKNIEGGGIFGNILKHFGKNKSKYIKMGSAVGKRVLKEAKSQLRKPENQKLLRKVTDHLIEKVASKIDQAPPRIKKRDMSQKKHRTGARVVSSRYRGNMPSSGLRQDLLTLTKKEAKKIAREKSKELVDNFSKYIE